MHGMSTFMHHGGNIMHLSGRIHEYKWSAGFSQRTIISSRRFTDPAFQIEAVHFFHGLKTVRKKRSEFSETLYRFFQEFFAGFKWIQRLLIDGLRIQIPWT